MLRFDLLISGDIPAEQDEISKAGFWGLEVLSSSAFLALICARFLINNEAPNGDEISSFEAYVFYTDTLYMLSTEFGEALLNRSPL